MTGTSIMNVDSILSIAVFLFPVSEVALLVVTRAGGKPALRTDRRSTRLLWVVIACSIFLAVALHEKAVLLLPLSRRVVAGMALLLFAAGFAIRWAAILSLGHLFSVDVTIQQNHQLVCRGPYRYVRHPSYTGLLIAFLGLSLYFGSWLSLAVIMVPITAAIFYRIRHEEAALLEALGEPYREYSARTKRLLPGLV